MRTPRMHPVLRALAPVAAVASLALATPAHAALLTYSASLSGPNESPPNASPGTGTATVYIDDVALTMRVVVNFSGLLGTTTASHIHCPTAAAGTGTAGVATTTPTFSGFPTGVQAGSYDNTLDMTLASSYNPSFVTAQGNTIPSARAVLFQAIADGKAYLNIHSSQFGGGEIRGFLTLVPTPVVPTSWGKIRAIYR